MIEEISSLQKAIDVISNWQKQRRRNKLLKAISQVENDYVQGNFKRGTVADLMAELKD